MRSVFLIEFYQQKEDDMNFEEMRIKINEPFLDMDLDIGRMMHQSEIITYRRENFFLVIGGKIGVTGHKAVFTKSVLGF